VLEQSQAVPVGPLQIVEEEHQPNALGKRSQEALELGKRALAQLQWIFHLAHRLRRDRANAVQHRKDAREMADVAARECHRARIVETGKIGGERIDDCIECFEGNRLLLVATAGKHHCVRLQRDVLLEESAH
jgi:hypothetical protein